MSTEPGKGSDAIQAPLEAPISRLVEPFQSFVASQTGSGWLLLTATITALAAANSPWADYYFALRHLELGVTFESLSFSLTLQHWVNDGLMAVFFFLLGLELKREFLVGRLSDPRKAASVVASAIGGMAVPALIFLAVAGNDTVRQAWAIPMATDTAFALAILVFLGDRVPLAARAFLVGLAIIDDLGAILVIAFFYSGELNFAQLPFALGTVLALALLNLSGVRKSWPYIFCGFLAWAAFLAIGLHGTLAGVVVALLAPVKPAISRDRFASALRHGLMGFRDRHDPEAANILEAPDQHETAQEVLEAARDATVPLKRWERRLEIPISYAVVPVFAFFNAGVGLSAAAMATAWHHELSLAIFLGLIFGKPVGILLGAGIGHLTGIARAPTELSALHLLGLGLLGGIGFTMSLFIATLSFGEGVLIDIARQAVIATSMLAGVAGFLVLRAAPPQSGEALTTRGPDPQSSHR